MYRIAVLGDYDSIYGFAALGLDIFPEEDPEEAAKKLHELAGGSYAVVYITEKLAEELSAVIEKYRERVFPAIIPDSRRVRQYGARSGERPQECGAGRGSGYSV